MPLPVITTVAHAFSNYAARFPTGFDQAKIRCKGVNLQSLMSHYSRAIPHHSRAVDEVYTLISGYSEGVTFNRLLREHAARLKDGSSVIASIYLLMEEGKVCTDVPWEGAEFKNKVLLRVC
jgi:hypothetical protein